MNDILSRPHIIYGEFVTEPVVLHLSPGQWQVVLIDLREDTDKLVCDKLNATEAREHVEDTAKRFIDFANKSEFIMRAMQMRGVSFGHNHYKFHPMLTEFFNQHGIKPVQLRYSDWGLRGFMWAGLHDEICLTGNITATRLAAPQFHNYILDGCTCNLIEDKKAFFHDYVRHAWNNVTLLNVDHVNLKTITYE